MDNPTLRSHIHTASTEDDVRAAATIIARAFNPLPVSKQLVPDQSARVDVMAAAFTINIAHAVDYGTVNLLTQVSGDRGTGGVVGAAVWIDRTRPVPEPDNYDQRLQRATGQFYGEFVRLDLLFAEHHPDQPHHYLALLAAAPGHQGQGIGTALLRHHHEDLDQHHLSAYLEASNPDSARLYQQHGYEHLGPDFELAPGAGFIPMWRVPNPGKIG